MLAYNLFKFIFSETEWMAPFLYLVVVILLLLRVRNDCRTLGESFRLHFLLILMFPIITGVCWLLIWPGALRLFVTGRSLEQSVQAGVFRRLQKSKGRASQEAEQDIVPNP